MMAASPEKNVLSCWKHPNELLKLQRLRNKNKQLTARINGQNLTKETKITDKESLLEAKLCKKRTNPFLKSGGNAAKKFKDSFVDEQNEDSLLELVNRTSREEVNSIEHAKPLKLHEKRNDLLSKYNKVNDDITLVPIEEDGPCEEQKYSKLLPMDWCITSRARFFCEDPLPATTLKASQMASSLTSFVRCIPTKNKCEGLDISHASRFNQGIFYWQHPYIPWLTLYPRNAKENSGIVVNEQERNALFHDWKESFRGLFQLLRARQCPYFYLCANGFTVLFRAAGVAGQCETHALVSSTTHGFRNVLRKENIEFTLPFKKDGLNKSSECSFSDENNTSIENGKCQNDMSGQDDDEDDEEEWLESLGVDEKELRKIRSEHARKLHSKEMSDDFSDNSAILIEGVECQSFFSYLLDAKSTISSVGRLAGVPPTLLAPVAFPKATIQQCTSRSNKVRMDGVSYNSIEVKGVILPTFLPYICGLLCEKETTFSATLAASNSTLIFTKATQKLLNDSKEIENDNMKLSSCVFLQESLSDCGLQPFLIENICRTEPNAVSLIERICYDKEHGYAWS